MSAIEDQRRWVICIDIGGIFDNLDHDLLRRGRPATSLLTDRLISRYTTGIGD